MAESPSHRLNPYGAYATVAACGGAASVLVALIPFYLLRQITDVGMAAIAAMVFAPAAMAVGVSYFVNRTATRTRGE